MKEGRPINILFMCAGNTSRSQIAEGLAKFYLGDQAKVQSAGSSPKLLDEDAVKVMAEIGIDISKNHSKSYDHLSPHFIDNLDYAVVLCDELVAPVFTAHSVKILNWPLQTPGREIEKFAALRALRDDLKRRLEIFAKEIRENVPASEFAQV